jgi:DNA-binding transcriptional ArsR family regulator
MDAKRKKDAAGVGRMLASLANPTRLLIVCLLMDRERFALELLQELGSTKGNISQHLRVLERQGHILSRREGQRVYYRIAEARLAHLMSTLQHLYCPGLSVKPGRPLTRSKP